MLYVCLSMIAVLPIGELTPRVERLESGLRIVIVEDQRLPLLSVQLWYCVGSADDDPNLPGLCHVTRKILEHRDRLRLSGACFLSRTLRDACFFSAVLLSNDLEHVLQIEAERMRPLQAVPETVTAGLRAVARECDLVSNSSQKIAERRILAAMFPNHPYQYPPGFVAESLKNLSAAKVNEFAQRWFVPSNATLFVIGDVNEVAVLELVRKHFGGLEWIQPPRRKAVPSPPAEQIRLPLAPAECIGLDIAWLTPPAGLYENAALDVLMHRLCNSVDGPLAKRLAELGCAQPHWRRESWREHGWLVLSVRLSQSGSEPEAPARDSGISGLNAIETAIQEALERTADVIPSPIEFNRARTLARRDVLLAQASFHKRAERFAWHELIAGDMLLAEFEKPRLAGTCVSDVRQAAQELPRARTVILPRQWSKGKGQDVEDKHERTELLVESPKVPATVTTHEFTNGVCAAVCRVAGMELVEVHTLLKGVRRLDRCIELLMAAGSTKHAAEQFQDYLTYHGLDLMPRDSGLVSRGTESHVAQMIELQAELVRDRNERVELKDLDDLSAVLVLVVGDVNPDEVIEVVHRAWGDWDTNVVTTHSVCETLLADEFGRFEIKSAGVHPPKGGRN